MVPPHHVYLVPLTYSGTDGLCGNALLLSLDTLVAEGLLEASELPEPHECTPEMDNEGRAIPADFDAAVRLKEPRIQKAARRLLEDDKFATLRQEMTAWRSREKWVEESALFAVLCDHEPTCRGEDGKAKIWWFWDLPLRKRDRFALAEMRKKYKDLIEEFIVAQFLFDRQWMALKDYANERQIKVVGDMPIYVGGQSADVWTDAKLFELDPQTLVPKLVSGVPPDAFSATGQLWGSPLYDWNAHEKEGFRWWTRRLQRALALHDEVRIDHFRGFAGYWAVDADAETAMGGVWKVGPGMRLFDALEKNLGDSGVIIAEDLGVITPDVHALRKTLGAPGMCVLQFAFGGSPTNTHLIHNVYENCFVYPGTHDNDTTVGWWIRTTEEVNLPPRSSQPRPEPEPEPEPERIVTSKPVSFPLSRWYHRPASGMSSYHAIRPRSVISTQFPPPLFPLCPFRRSVTE